LEALNKATIGRKDQNKSLFSVWEVLFQASYARRNRSALKIMEEGREGLVKGKSIAPHLLNPNRGRPLNDVSSKLSNTVSLLDDNNTYISRMVTLIQTNGDYDKLMQGMDDEQGDLDQI
jgi:chromosome transmission fidelity protein 18